MADEAARIILDSFLKEVINTPLKVRILEFFFQTRGTHFTSTQIAANMDNSPASVCAALQELSSAGVFLNCPAFGDGDLCILTKAHQSEETSGKIELLRRALLDDADSVLSHFKGKDGVNW